jgi:L-ascorbate metabolism protein UlaG (beta-lactamase superfamily)
VRTHHDVGFPEHFDGKHFFNPDAPQARGLFDLIRWKLSSRPEPGARFISDVKPSKPPSGVAGNELRVTLINHSTVLLQQNDTHILTDPIWSERASPFQSIGPRRRREPGVRWDDLPRIDIVLISHNHYDHLDLATLRRLTDRGQCQFIVPSGISRFLLSRKIGPVHELDWGESLAIGQTGIHSVPAVHFSARGVFDRNRTLWCGYTIEIGGRVIYFAGDTGFGGHFVRIRERFGAPRLALLPIGAFEPRWFMSAVHMAPDEAVRAHQILGARTSIAIHHGTFQLGDDGVDTPKRLLRACAAGDSFLVPDNGQSVTLES